MDPAYPLLGTNAHTLIANLHLNLTWDPTNAAIQPALLNPQFSLHPQLLQARPSPDLHPRSGGDKP